MSKNYTDEYRKPTEKIIGIKSLHDINPQNEQSNTYIDSDEEVNQLQDKILMAKKELQALEDEKSKLLQDTLEEIKLERDNWENEKKNLIIQAKESGYEQGFDLGKNESMEQYKELLSEANSIVSAATKDYYTKVNQSEETIIKIAIHTAEKIIKSKIVDKPEVFLDVISAAINEIKDRSRISIYLHPNNYTFIMLQKDELLGVLDGDTNLSIFIDQKISEDSCIIEHPFGQVDASIDTQLDEIRNVLNEVVEEGSQ